MQGLADGYFIIPYTIADYLARTEPGKVRSDGDEFRDSAAQVEGLTNKLLAINGRKTVNEFHRELGHIMWEDVGMARSKESLENALEKIPALREEFWNNVRVPGSGADLNQELEKAGRVADYLEFGELLTRDALNRDESCGGHFRVEHQTEDGEAVRKDDQYSYVAAWEYGGAGKTPQLHKEPLIFENIELAVRSYK